MAGQATYADHVTHLKIRLRRADGSPVVAGEVVVQRRRSGTWRLFDTVVTDEEGRAVVDATLARRAADNLFRASYAGGLDAADTTGPVAVKLVRRSSRVTIGGPHKVVDEQSVRVPVSWQTGNGLPVNGIVRLQRRNGGGDWRLVRRLRTGADGRAHLTTRPRVDTAWRAEGRRLDWVFGDSSDVHRINNLPPGDPVRLRARRRAPGSTCPTSGMLSAPGRTRTSRRSPRGSGTR